MCSETDKLQPVGMKVTIIVSGPQAIACDEQFKELWKLTGNKNAQE